jgi:hypothetical protein
VPIPRVPDDRVGSPEELVGLATDLTDYEVMKVGQIVTDLVSRYGHRANNADNLNALRDEALTRFAEIGILATLDPAPCFHGEPPTIEIIGKVTGHDDHKYGFDHERKRDEVVKSKELNEDYRGQKEKHTG